MANGFKSAMQKVDGLLHHHHHHRRRKDGKEDSNSGRSTSSADLASQRLARRKEKVRKRSERAVAKKNAGKALVALKQQRLDKFQSAYVRLKRSILSLLGRRTDMLVLSSFRCHRQCFIFRKMIPLGLTLDTYHTMEGPGWNRSQDRISLLSPQHL